MAYQIKGDVEVGRGFGLGRMTTVERTAYVPAQEGYTVWDTDLDRIYSWNGSVWTGGDAVAGGKFKGAYSSTSAYEVDDMVVHNGVLFTSNSNRSAGTWSISPQEGIGADQFRRITGRDRGPFNSDYNYAIGDVAYDNSGSLGTPVGFYRAIAPHTSGNAPSSANWTLLGGAGRDRHFVFDGVVSPGIPGAPTPAEIATALNFVFPSPIRDTIVYYTGTNTDTDPITHVFHVDLTGAVTLLRNPGSGASGIDTVLSVGQPLTASRSIAGNNNTFLIENGNGGTFADTSFEPDRVLISVSTPGAPSDSFIRVSDDETVIQTSSGGVNRIEVLGSEISMLSDGLGVNLRNRTVMRFEDAAASTVGFRAPATITTPVVWNLPVADGTVDQALITNGAGDLSWSAFGKANARIHADEATVAPALAGSPTLAEITTFVTGAAVRDALVYYTGTNLGTDPVTHVYWSDAAGVVTLLRSPGTGAVGIDDVLGVGQQLTADRTIDSNGNVLDIQSGVLGVAPATLLRVRPVDVSMTAANAALTETSSFTLVPGVGTITTSNAVTSSTLDIFPTGFSFLSDPAGNGVVLLNETRLSFQDSVAGNRVAFKAAASIPANVVWTLPTTDGTIGQAITTNGTGTLSWSSIAKNRVFASETAVAPALAGSPNLVEITAFVTTGNITDTLVYYTGTNTNTDAITHVYAVDAAGVVTALRVPGSSTSGLDDVLAVGQTIAANRLVEVSNSTLTTIGTNTTTADSTNLSINSTQVQIDSVSALGNSSGVSLSGGVIGISSNNAATLGPNGLATITMNSGVMDIAGGLNVSLQSAAGGILMVAPANGVNIEQGTSLKFKEDPLNGANTVGFRAPTTITTDVLWTLPAADGSAGQALTTNGAGVLAWASGSTGGGIDDVLAVGQIITSNRDITVNNATLTTTANDTALNLASSYTMLGQQHQLITTDTTTNVYGFLDITSGAVRLESNQTATTGVDGFANIILGGAQASLNGHSGININSNNAGITFTAATGVRIKSGTNLVFEEDTANGGEFLAFRAPAAITTSAVWTLPNGDGTAGQALTTNGAGVLSWASAGGSANQRVFASESLVLPAISGSPTLTEMSAYIASTGLTFTTFYYTGTDTGTDPVTHVYWTDNFSPAILLRGPGGSSSGIDDVLAVGQTITTNRNISISDAQFTTTALNTTTGFTATHIISNSTQVVTVTGTAGDSSSLILGDNSTTLRTETPSLGSTGTSDVILTQGQINLNGPLGINLDSGFAPVTITTNQGLRLKNYTPIMLEADSSVSSNALGFRAPAVVTTTTLWELPDGDGPGGHVLATGGNTVLEWVPHTIINPQPASGYTDIGITRMQWGQDTTNGSGNVTITMPFPMANAAYSICITSDAPTGGVVVSYHSLTTSGFSVKTTDLTGADISSGFSWLAIGRAA